MTKVAALAIFFAAASPAWIESAEFPWNVCPRPLWERELVWFKNIGITHVSLPPGGDTAQLTELLRIIRGLDLEADLEGPVPDEFQPLIRSHGGPLTEPLPGPPMRVSALSPTATTTARELVLAGTGALLWTDVAATLGPAGYRRGAIGFRGEETPASIPLRRAAQVSTYWNRTFASMHEIPEAVSKPAVAPRQEISVRQLAADNGASILSVVNKSAVVWTGDLKVFYAAAKRVISVPGISVPPHDALWLPVNVPLIAGPLCRDCSAFSNSEHIVYATDELTGMEYENGILAMEFAAPYPGEVILQLSREPSGPLVAGGRPAEFVWDERTQRARLKIPAGSGGDKHVRIGIAIEPPEATAFFDSARVLIIGETNRLTAQFSSPSIAQRSRLRIPSAFAVDQQPGDQPLGLVYQIKVPPTFIHGDHADLAIEADGMRMSHARPQLLNAVTLSFPDAIGVHLAPDSVLPLWPSTIPLNQRTGRDLIVTLRNNAPEIRNFAIEPKADGMQFSPSRLEVTVGASAARDLSFRIFAQDTPPGVRAGVVLISGAAVSSEPIQFVVIRQNGSETYSVEGLSFIESAKSRASFVPGRWLELVNKESGQSLLPANGVAFTPGAIDTRPGELIFGGQRTLTLNDLEQLALKSGR